MWVCAGWKIKVNKVKTVQTCRGWLDVVIIRISCIVHKSIVNDGDCGQFLNDLKSILKGYFRVISRG